MKAKGILLASVAGTVVAPAAASAADMPVKAAPKAVAAPVVVAPSWAGLYVGVHAGAAWHKASASQQANYYGDTRLSDTNTGFSGGGLIGYNFQSGNIVAGVEGDISGLSGNVDEGRRTIFGGAGHITANADMDWMATLRARLGFAAGNWLFFVTGGVAWANIENKLIYQEVGGVRVTWSDSGTRTAGVFGGGVDYMFSPNWIGRLEALWADFGDTKVKTGHIAGGGTQSGKPTTFKNKVMVVRGALSYKF